MAMSKLKLERWLGSRLPQPCESCWSSETIFCKDRAAMLGTVGTGGGSFTQLEVTVLSTVPGSVNKTDSVPALIKFVFWFGKDTMK